MLLKTWIEWVGLKVFLVGGLPTVMNIQCTPRGDVLPPTADVPVASDFSRMRSIRRKQEGLSIVVKVEFLRTTSQTRSHAVKGHFYHPAPMGVGTTEQFKASLAPGLRS